MKAFFGNLVALLIVAAISYAYFTDKADLRYNLSQRIPTTFTGENSSENIQLLEVNNIGKSEATGIIVKSNKQIARFEIQKYMKTDKMDSSKDGEPFEVKYGSLPPGANFKIILKSVGEGMTSNDISIIHSKGKASDVFTNSSSWGYVLFILCTGLLNLIIMVVNIKDFGVKRFEFVHNIDSVLKMKKPYYMNMEKWDTLKREAWEWKVSKDVSGFYSDPLKSSSYSVLSSDKPGDIDDESWNKIIEKATDIFTIIIKIHINSYFGNNKVIDIINLNKPSNITNEKWKDINKIILDGFRQNEKNNTKHGSLKELEQLYDNKFPYESNDILSKIYQDIIRKQYNERLYDSVRLSREPYTLIKTSRTDILEENDKDNLVRIAYKMQLANVVTNIFSNRYVANTELKSDIFEIDDTQNINSMVSQTQYLRALRDIRNSKDPLKYINENELNMLDKDDVEVLYKIAYQQAVLAFYPVVSYENACKILEIKMPNWMNVNDYDCLIELSNKIVKLHNNVTEYKYLTEGLKNILRNRPIDRNKPMSVDEDNFNSLIVIENDIYNSNKKNCILSAKNEINKKRINVLKSKLLTQLNIINDILTDPTVIDRIEDYNNPFAPGNFANLKKMSKILIESKVV